MSKRFEFLIHKTDPRQRPGQRKLVEVWLDFRSGTTYALCDPRLPVGLGERMSAAVLALVDDDSDYWQVETTNGSSR